MARVAVTWGLRMPAENLVACLSLASALSRSVARRVALLVCRRHSRPCPARARLRVSNPSCITRVVLHYTR